MRPSSLKEDKKATRWPINLNNGTADEKAWAMVIGIESGWLGYDKGGHLQWTAAGRDKHTALVGISERFNSDSRRTHWKVPDREPEEDGPDLADEPVAAKPGQLDLFA